MPTDHHHHNTTAAIRGQDYYRRSKLWAQDLAYVQYLRWLDQGDTADMRLRNASDRIYHCGDYWSGYQCAACGAYHAMITYGCHHRLCPICSVRRSRATAAQAVDAMAIMAAMLAGQPYTLHLLTLTQRNVPADRLAAEIDALLAAWSALRLRRIIRTDLIGWGRTVEITRAQDGSYHPHIHVMIAIRAGSSLAEDRTWRDLWRAVMALSYDPICDCRPITDIAAVYEVSKYVTKLSRMYAQPPGQLYDEVSAIDTAIAGRRLRTYGGAWAKARKMARMIDADDMTDAQLAAVADGIDHVPTSCQCGGALMPVVLLWAGMDYRTISGGAIYG